MSNSKREKQLPLIKDGDGDLASQTKATTQNKKEGIGARIQIEENNRQAPENKLAELKRKYFQTCTDIISCANNLEQIKIWKSQDDQAYEEYKKQFNEKDETMRPMWPKRVAWAEENLKWLEAERDRLLNQISSIDPNTAEDIVKKNKEATIQSEAGTQLATLRERHYHTCRTIEILTRHIREMEVWQIENNKAYEKHKNKQFERINIEEEKETLQGEISGAKNDLKRLEAKRDRLSDQISIIESNTAKRAESDTAKKVIKKMNKRKKSLLSSTKIKRGGNDLAPRTKATVQNNKNNKERTEGQINKEEAKARIRIIEDTIKSLRQDKDKKEKEYEKICTEIKNSTKDTKELERLQRKKIGLSVEISTILSKIKNKETEIEAIKKHCNLE